MRKILKSRIFTFILGILITISIVGVYAISANEITYNNTTVDQALNDLYNNANMDILDRLGINNSKVTILTSYGDKQTRTVEFNLNAGSYLIVGSESISLNNNNFSSSDGFSSFSKPLDENNCTFINGKYAQSVATDMVADKDQVLITRTSLYVCKFSTNTSLTVTTNSMGHVSNENVNLTAFAIKLD